MLNAIIWIVVGILLCAGWIASVFFAFCAGIKTEREQKTALRKKEEAKNEDI